MCKVSTAMTRIIFADGTNLTICKIENNIETIVDIILNATELHKHEFGRGNVTSL